MDQPVFEARGLGYTYGESVVGLAGVDLVVAAGQRVAILGANGSGKSTLLKVLNGLYLPTEGEVWAFGQPLTVENLADEDWAYAFRRRVGLVFQDSDVQLFCPTVWDEVAFGPLQLGLVETEIIQRVRITLERLGIAGLADRAPHRLSGGEKKKVALASVLVLEPQVLLLDEPTANLDPRTQGELLELLDEMRANGCTLVTATHDLGLAVELADWALVLGEDHRPTFRGPIQQALADQGLLGRCNLASPRRQRVLS